MCNAVKHSCGHQHLYVGFWALTNTGLLISNDIASLSVRSSITGSLRNSILGLSTKAFYFRAFENSIIVLSMRNVITGLSMRNSFTVLLMNNSIVALSMRNSIARLLRKKKFYYIWLLISYVFIVVPIRNSLTGSWWTILGLSLSNSIASLLNNSITELSMRNSITGLSRRNSITGLLLRNAITWFSEKFSYSVLD